jgi:hypothetical protein
VIVVKGAQCNQEKACKFDDMERLCDNCAIGSSKGYSQEKQPDQGRTRDVNRARLSSRSIFNYKDSKCVIEHACKAS